MPGKNSTLLEEVVRFHKSRMEAISYPCSLSVRELEEMAPFSHFFPPADPSLFVVIDTSPLLPGLNFPLLKHLTPLTAHSTSHLDHIIPFLQEHGRQLLALIESYNPTADKLMHRLPHEPTYYCQQKLLCHVSDLQLSRREALENVAIRNFIPARDEASYAAFYNRVLGSLAERTVEKEFVDFIVSRPSFDPGGYFVAETEGEVVGFLSIEKEPWGEPGSGFGYIYQIGVADTHQGTGLADLMLQKAHAFALQNGITRVGVGVRKSNFAAMGFFLKHGFHVAYEVRGLLVNLG